jgi:hypothetical protein
MVDLALLFGWQSDITHEDLDWRDGQWKEATLAMKKQNDDCTDVYTTVLNPGATRHHLAADAPEPPTGRREAHRQAPVPDAAGS